MFTRPPEAHLPDLSPREELVLLARTLWREGYNDHLAGHITVNLGDGTLLCNPWLLPGRSCAPQVLRIDLDGAWSRGTGRSRSASRSTSSCTSCATTWGGPCTTTRSSARSGPTWAGCPLLRPELALGGGELVVVDEYDGPVNDASSARSAVEKMGDASMALLAGHGVFVLGGSARAVHQRAVALEQRCQHAWSRPGCPRPSSTWWPGATARASSASGRRRCAPSWRPTPSCSTDYAPDEVPKTSFSSIGTGVSSWPYVHEAGSRSGRQRTKDVAWRNRSCCRWS
jgi:L-ribulose-5-phosphate 4-epimerase